MIGEGGGVINSTSFIRPFWIVVTPKSNYISPYKSFPRPISEITNKNWSFCLNTPNIGTVKKVCITSDVELLFQAGVYIFQNYNPPPFDELEGKKKR